MYHAYKKDRKSFAQIKLGDKTFSTNKNDEWEEKPSKVDYQAWIDSTKEGLRMLDKPFKDCALEREVKLTGTPYAVYAVYIENDTISVFLNQKTDKIERFKGRNYAKGISYTAYFDLPFEIKAPKIPSEKTNKYTYFNLFPPMYSDNEDYDGNEPVFVFGDKTAEFEDGQAKMFQFLGMNVRYPEKARKNGVEGTVYIGFVVEKDGAITNINLKRGIAKDCNAEAIRVIELMSGKWNAGEFQGKKVRMAYTLPIKFKLE